MLPPSDASRSTDTTGLSAAELQSRLDSLASAKREATEAQIATIGRIRASLSEDQFKQLLKLASSAGSH